MTDENGFPSFEQIGPLVGFQTLGLFAIVFLFGDYASTGEGFSLSAGLVLLLGHLSVQLGYTAYPTMIGLASLVVAVLALGGKVLALLLGAVSVAKGLGALAGLSVFTVHFMGGVERAVQRI